MSESACHSPPKKKKKEGREDQMHSESALSAEIRELFADLDRNLNERERLRLLEQREYEERVRREEQLERAQEMAVLQDVTSLLQQMVQRKTAMQPPHPHSALMEADGQPTTSSGLFSCHFQRAKENDPGLSLKSNPTPYWEQEMPKGSHLKIEEVVFKKEEEEEVPCSAEDAEVCPVESVNVHTGVNCQNDTECMFVCAEKVALEIELERTKAELRALKEKEAHWCHRYSAAQLSKEVIRMETGLPDRGTLNTIAGRVLHCKDSVCYSAGWKVECITVEDQVFLTLMKLRHNYTDLHLAALFNCSVAVIQNVTATFTGILRQLPFKDIMAVPPILTEMNIQTDT
ncbi:uncharacterized protein LOC115361510 isoform X2 [Myripristis murdjan]|uniref:uncharacterized protein LOC115361510 isoform X2 n=2 Tax=Myripristis murdjan TaxID=586833 RepID=UPI001175FE6D|nr:uncharacterized protein LOC115361510 isoform X2 [Myripristis murdjan]